MLGIEIKQNRQARTISLRQKHYIDAIFQRFNIKGRDYQVLMQQGLYLKTNKDGNNDNIEQYMNMIGALRYAADCTRPDIAFTTSLLARFLNKPDMTHLKATLQCFNYLRTTNDYWLTLGGQNEASLIGYTDADGMMQEEHKAISGYVFQLGRSTISWSSKKQKLVSLSTYEAELQALAHATQEAIWLRNIYHEVLQTSSNLITVPIYCDNLSLVNTSNQDELRFSTLTKHLDLRRHFIKDYINKTFISVHYIPTKLQIADLLTKALPAIQHKSLTSLLRLSNDLQGSINITII